MLYSSLPIELKVATLGINTELLNKEKNELGSDIESDEKEMSELGRELELLRKEKEQLQLDVESLNKEMYAVGSDLELLDKENINLRNDKTVLEKDIELLDNEKNKIGSELELMITEKALIANDVELLKEEKNTLHHFLEGQKAEFIASAIDEVLESIHKREKRLAKNERLVARDTQELREVRQELIKQMESEKITRNRVIGLKKRKRGEPVLWNFREKKRATLKEVIVFNSTVEIRKLTNIFTSLCKNGLRIFSFTVRMW